MAGEGGSSRGPYPQNELTARHADFNPIDFLCGSLSFGIADLRRAFEYRGERGLAR